MPIPQLSGILSDEVITSTKLNRKTSEVLDIARDRLVTITRNDEQFALWRRDRVARLIQENNMSLLVLELLNTAQTLVREESVSSEHPGAWLSVFDSEDLKDFTTELISEYLRISRGSRDLSELEALIHEWYESALATSSPELESAFYGEDDEVQITPPSIDSYEESTLV